MEFLSWFCDEMKDALVDWPLGTIVGVLVIVVVLLIVGLILWGVFIAVDSWFRPRSRKVGRVIDKTFTPAHTEMVYNAALKMMTPQFVDDDWTVSVEVDGQQDSMSVPEEFYDSLAVGKSVWVDYETGRLSGDLYIKELSHA